MGYNFRLFLALTENMYSIIFCMGKEIHIILYKCQIIEFKSFSIWFV